MADNAYIHVQIEPRVKDQAERILATLGVPVPVAINMFYKQIILQQGIPFDVRMPRGGHEDFGAASPGGPETEETGGNAASDDPGGEYQDEFTDRIKVVAAQVFENFRKGLGV